MRAVIEKGLHVLGEHDQVILQWFLISLDSRKISSLIWLRHTTWSMLRKQTRSMTTSTTYSSTLSRRVRRPGWSNWSIAWLSNYYSLSNRIRFTKNANQELARMLALRQLAQGKVATAHVISHRLIRNRLTSCSAEMLTTLQWQSMSLWSRPTRTPNSTSSWDVPCSSSFLGQITSTYRGDSENSTSLLWSRPFSTSWICSPNWLKLRTSTCTRKQLRNTRLKSGEIPIS